MALRYAPLFSGSSGNCTYVGSDGAGFLVDAGVSGQRILSALKSLQIDVPTIRALLVTHEHADHISGAGILARKLGIPVYATADTWSAMENKIGAIESRNVRVLTPGEWFSLPEVDVCPFSIPHDAADPVGFHFVSGSTSFTIATDIGCVREDWLRHARESNAVLLEANYDPDMLAAGKYPYALKKRIFSRKGHLCNDDAGDVSATLVKSGVRSIVLGHLSKENNFPELAWQTVRTHLEINGVAPGRDVDLRVADRTGPIGLFKIESTFQWT